MRKQFQIRYYQEEAILALYNYWAAKNGNPIIALPTGTGKSVVIAEFLRSVFTYFPGQRVLMLTHVKELVSQNYQELIDLWPLAPAGIYSAGLGRKEIRPITFAGIASIVKKAVELGWVDLVGIDECHLVSPHDETMYQNLIADLKVINPNLKVFGLTATPYRLGQGMLTWPIETKQGPRPSLFTDICFDYTTKEKFNKLLEEGFMCWLVPKPAKQMVDVSKVGTSMGEFKLDELQKAMDKAEVTRRAITELSEEAFRLPHSSGRPRCRWLIFATGIEHCEHVAAEFAARGFNVRCVHSKTAGGIRDDAVAWFKEETEDVRVLVNNGVFTTGFNCKQLDVIGMLRATNSPGLWVQILGRGTRPYEGKDNCLVMDFAGNAKRLGPINDPVIPRRKGQKGGGEAPIKICEACGVYNHASVRFCTACGNEFEQRVKFSSAANEQELIRSDAPQIEIFPVARVEYDVHHPFRAEKPPSLKVTYRSGLRAFTEWVCFEHMGLVAQKARHFWRRAAGTDLPQSTEEAHRRAKELRAPVAIRVWVNQRHPRVMDRDYGSGFETPGNSGKPEKIATLQLGAN